ncbi:multifunctional protein ADE2 [Trichomycterus rosablanca]|uniref:multifunctional protein ADE2 n=1 Tax=Trichomycterus rosablanca TaxID=2290929 RepID=UPI002F356708
MALPDWRPPASQTQMDGILTKRLYEMEEGQSSPANRREGTSSLSNFQDGMEGGRHWSDKEVRALLNIWAEREMQVRLQSTHRNKAIFQEMARRLEIQHGVVRDWRQCRTKYKNLKYDYKVSKSQGRPMRFFTEVDTILQGKELEDLIDEEEDFTRQEPERDQSAGRKEPGEDYIKIDDVRNVIKKFAKHGTVKNLPGCGGKRKIDERCLRSLVRMVEKTPCQTSKDLKANLEQSGVMVSINESLADLQTIINTGSHHFITNDMGPTVSPLSRRQSEEENIITLHDSGRNWSEEEVAALLNIWSEEGIQDQLQGSTRNKDVFVQISRRLLQQGVERDWKQCRTKYKNLKYLYRSLQRGKADVGDTRRIMKFYEQLDNILSRPTRGMYRNSVMFSSPTFEEHSMCEMSAHEDGDIIAFESDQVIDNTILTTSSGVATRAAQSEARTDATSRRMDNVTEVDYEKEAQVNSMLVTSKDSAQARHEEQPLPSRVVLRSSNGDQEYKANRDDTETFVEMRAGVSARGRKRKGTDEDYSQTSKRFQQSTDDGDSSTDWSEHIDYQFKEEQDQYIPIMEISSVCSMASSPTITENLDKPHSTEMASTTDLKLGKKLNEGKTKQIFELLDMPGHVLVQSKDQITAGNAVRKDQMEGKAAISNKTTSCVFKLLQDSGIKTAFVKQHSESAFIATHCEMIPIEWVCRRIATGSFLKRNPGVKEGYRFSPLKMEMFFKDDANNDPQWSEEQLLAAVFDLAGLTIGRCEVDIMSKSTVAIFEILEKAWATQNCTLVDMKIEFGVNVNTKEIVLADVIDNDSWRLWPAGDRSQQKDKQVYRDLKEITPEAMQMVKRNFEWVAERVQLVLEPQTSGRVVVLMGSTSDMAHCEKIRKACSTYGVSCDLRVTSAHKGPDETLRIKAEYEGDGVSTIFVAVAGRSNGLGPVMSGNTAFPVINCPPVTPDWGAQDIWSSLRMPSGLGCSTVLSPDSAAQHAAQILGLTNHLVWSKLRASMLNTWISLKQADKKLQQCSI